MDVLVIALAVVGGLVLYCALLAGLWAVVVRLVRRRGRRMRTAAPTPVTTVAPAPVPVPGPAAAPVTATAPVTAASATERRASTWDQLPDWLARDRPWAITVVLLGAPEIRERTQPFVDFRRRRIDWEGLFDEATAWSPNERLLVTTAYDLSGGPARSVDPTPAPQPVTLNEVASVLDERNVRRVLVALDLRRGRCELDEALAQLVG